jgi:hypothetical protein
MDGPDVLTQGEHLDGGGVGAVRNPRGLPGHGVRTMLALGLDEARQDRSRGDGRQARRTLRGSPPLPVRLIGIQRRPPLKQQKMRAVTDVDEYVDA